MPKYDVWFVDDLPENLKKFENNHGGYFAVRTFNMPAQVLREIHAKNYPHALLCDIFFYDSVDEAERVEAKVAELVRTLRKTAIDIGVNDHQRAAGITLMKSIYEHFGNQPPPFPMYAYTSKGPFLLEQRDWENISKFGAEVLLKNRVTPDNERIEIEGDIALFEAKNSWLGWFNTTSRKIGLALVPPLITLVVGRLLRGHW